MNDMDSPTFPRRAWILIVWLLAWCLIGVARGQELPPPLLLYPEGTTATGQGIAAQLNLAPLRDVLPGARVDFRAPDGRTYALVFDSLRTSKSGNVLWVGHLRDYGTDYRAMITWGAAGGFGAIATPDGRFRLETANGTTRLLAPATGGQEAPMGDDPPIPPPRPHAAAPQGITAAADQALGLTQIDLMVVYTSGLAATLGRDGVRTRIEHLVALANQAYVDSQVNIQLRLVYSGEVAYSDQASLDTALTDLTYGNGPFAGVSSLRSQYGADLVALLQQYDASGSASCGLGWLNGGNSSSLDASYGFGVAANGSDIRGSNSFCGDYTLAHELGHTMGSAHDRGHTSGAGAYPYSYGYGVSGAFGTIMSYYHPTVGKFSNPAISCASGLACGVSEIDPANGANNALSLNNTRGTVAGFLPASGLDTTPDGFAFTALEGVEPGATLYSESFVVSGLTVSGVNGLPTAVGASAPISITGGEYSIEGGAYTASPSTVTNGQRVQVRLTAATGAYAPASAMLTVGTLSTAFRVVSRPQSSSIVPAVAAAFSHGLALRADGVVYSWGTNSKGQLGNGGTASNPVPSALSALSNVTALAAMGDYSVALKSDGSVWTWGDNTFQQLRVGSASFVATPTQISGLTGIRQVSSGMYSSVALDGSGRVWEWGFVSAPRQVAGISTAVAVAAGLSHRMALLANGSVVAWGDNSLGQIGVTGTSWAFSPVTVPGLSGVRAIAAGDDFNLALLNDGTVRAWGANEAGQLGDGSTTQRHTPQPVNGLSNVSSIAAGGSFGLARRSDGKLLAWGANSAGQLGDGTETDRLIPVQLSLSNVAAIAAGPYHSQAMLLDGSVWSWGNNYYGQLGNGIANGPNVDTPARIGGSEWIIGATDMQPAGMSFGTASAPAGTWGQSAAVVVSGINVSSPVSILGGEYSLDGGAFTSAAGSLVSGQSLILRVLVPASGSSTATVTVGGLQAMFTVTAATPSISISPASLAFGSLSQGSTSSRVVTLSNTGALVVNISTILASGDYGQSHNCGSTLAPAANCTITVTFTPTATGSRTGTLSITDNAAGSPHGVSLAGTGLAPPEAVTASLVAGWNLLGNGTTSTIDVAATFGDPARVLTIWKWQPAGGGNWAYYAPGQTNGGADFAATKGYGLLTAIAPGEGFWVNAKLAFTVPLGGTTRFSLVSLQDSGSTPLPSGWSLIAVGDGTSPRAFANGIASSAPANGNPAATSILSLWAWHPGDAANAAGWLFYTPDQDNSGTLATYIAGKGYLHFDTLGKTLDATTGFWVRKP